MSSSLSTNLYYCASKAHLNYIYVSVVRASLELSDYLKSINIDLYF